MQTLTYTATSPSQAHADSAQALRCVSSGYMADGCSCQATVPADVVKAAWAYRLGRRRAQEDQFFTFVWQGGQWLAFGLRDGRVRGVYCPEHSAMRAKHSHDTAVEAEL
jgi:hypothetical protein